jgi:hypothetical protein
VASRAWRQASHGGNGAGLRSAEARYSAALHRRASTCGASARRLADADRSRIAGAAPIRLHAPNQRLGASRVQQPTVAAVGLARGAVRRLHTARWTRPQMQSAGLGRVRPLHACLPVSDQRLGGRTARRAVSNERSCMRHASRGRLVAVLQREARRAPEPCPGRLHVGSLGRAPATWAPALSPAQSSSHTALSLAHRRWPRGATEPVLGGAELCSPACKSRRRLSA